MARNIRLPLTVLTLILVGYSLIAASSPSARDSALNPTDYEYLFRNFVWFQHQSPEVQSRLRTLHSEFERLSDDEKSRITRVLQNYQAWLARLPDDDRRRVLDASDANSRFSVIRELREREWIASLPKREREELERLQGDLRKNRLRQMRSNDAERREDWALSQRNRGDYLPGQVPKVFQGEAIVAIDRFVENLKHALVESERRDLEFAKTVAHEPPPYTDYWPYVRLVAKLAETHPLIPGRVGPIDFESLPKEIAASLPKDVRDHFTNKDRVLKKVGTVVSESSVGRWPDFSIELTKVCRRKGVPIPPLGDCSREQMPPEVLEAVKSLESKLKGNDLRALRKIEELKGQWPEYPLAIMELFRKHGVAAPGWSLPGPPQVWDRLRVAKGRTK